MSDHKIVNGICLQCLKNYCDAITEKQTKINSLVAEMNNMSFPHLTALIKINDGTRKVEQKSTADKQSSKKSKKQKIEKIHKETDEDESHDG